MKRFISLIIIGGLAYLGYQWYQNRNENPEHLVITGEVHGSIMLLGKAFIEVEEQDSGETYYVYSDNCCAEKGDTYTFHIQSSELARVNDRALTLYTENKRVLTP